MANIAAAQSGSFSATSTWVGGVVPGSGDVAFANTFTVTISNALTVQALSIGSGTGITAGGVFSLLNGANLTFTNASGLVNGTESSPVVNTVSLGAGSTAVVSGPSLTPTAGFRGLAIAHSGSGTLNLITNISAATNQINAAGLVALSGIGTLNTTGSVVGHLSANGNAISGAIVVSGSGTLNHTGSVVGGSFASSNPISGLALGILISASNASVTVNGPVTGGSPGYNPGIANSSSSTLTVNGVCTSSATAAAIGPGAAVQVTRLSGPLLLGPSGNINPVQAQSWRWAPTLVPTYMQVPQSDGSTLRLLYSADNMPEAGYPAAGNVRHSVVYGPTQELTGTLVVPPPSSVAVGVVTDNTVGTAVLTAAAAAAAVWGAETRTLTSSSGSAPTAEEVAVAVEAAIATELGQINALALQMPSKASVDQVAAIVQGATSA